MAALRNAANETRPRSIDSASAALDLSEADEEMSHLQADGFWGPEKGFHDAEQLRKQSQREN
jgi:hypothetical protein